MRRPKRNKRGGDPDPFGINLNLPSCSKVPLTVGPLASAQVNHKSFELHATTVVYLRYSIRTEYEGLDQGRILKATRNQSVIKFDRASWTLVSRRVKYVKKEKVLNSFAVTPCDG